VYHLNKEASQEGHNEIVQLRISFSVYHLNKEASQEGHDEIVQLSETTVIGNHREISNQYFVLLSAGITQYCLITTLIRVMPIINILEVVLKNSLALHTWEVPNTSQIMDLEIKMI